ncbi:MAG: hypothetical protein SPK50_08445 [Mobiluncus porci]|uniref:hypothetical protein n=1 Tax=Mobiluncus porci TaxID=2652278 RepID=UPI0023F2D757|nr:hypothetical protein [Mobiluncus porci]MDD7542343.1 hypothetical protein [Mobiluncus porci]MDY5749142.1 hypothetical protein [Mobiluncus porci]
MSLSVGLTSYGMYRDISQTGATQKSSASESFSEDETKTIAISVPSADGASIVSSSVQSRRPTTSAEAAALAVGFEAQAAQYLEQARAAESTQNGNPQQLRANAAQARQQAQAMRGIEMSLAAKEAREAQAEAQRLTQTAKAEQAEKAEKTKTATAPTPPYAIENDNTATPLGAAPTDSQTAEESRKIEAKQDEAESRLVKLQMAQAIFWTQQLREVQ